MDVLRLDGLLAKTQPTIDVDSVPVVGTNAVRVSRRLWSTLTPIYKWENLRADVASGSIVPVAPALPRGRYFKLDIFHEVTPIGSDVAPTSSPLYRCSGWTETHGASLWSYAQASSAHEMASIYAYAGGVLFKLINCRGRWQWPWVDGEIATHQFTVYGVLAAEPATTALPGGFVYPSNEPIAGVATGTTIGAWSPDWLTGSFDPIGVDPTVFDSGNGVDGIREFDYGVVDPTFEITARKPVLATYDMYADLKARTQRALVSTWGTGAFGRVKLLNTNLRLRQITQNDADGFANVTLRYFVEAGATLQYD
jgi:hypothetical protein